MMLTVETEARGEKTSASPTFRDAHISVMGSNIFFRLSKICYTYAVCTAPAVRAATRMQYVLLLLSVLQHDICYCYCTSMELSAI